MSVRILGVDTGWCATGLAVVEWDGETARLVEHHTITTKPTAKKMRLLVVDDHLRRIREIRRTMESFLPRGSVRVVALEALSLARNAGSAARQAMAYAVAVCVVGDLPVVQYTPQQVRKNLGVVVAKAPPNLPKAEKVRDDLDVKRIVWRAAARLCSAPWMELTDHEGDALSVALACLYPEPCDLVRACEAGRAT